MVQPLGVAVLRKAIADEGEARSAQRDQLMGVHGNIAGILAAEGGVGSAILQEVAGHPMIFDSSREVLDRLAPITAMQLCSTLAGGTDQNHGEASVVRHRDQRRLALARTALDPDLLRVRSLIALEIIEPASRAPAPRPQ